MADCTSKNVEQRIGDPQSLEEFHKTLELRAKAELQLASFCEKLIVFGAGGIGGGITVAAGIVTKVGRIEGYTFLLISILCMGVASAGALALYVQCSASSYLDLRITAAAKLDSREIYEMANKKRSRIFKRWIDFLMRIGKRGDSFAAASKRVYASVAFGMLLLNGFVQYVLFVLANMRKFPH